MIHPSAPGAHFTYCSNIHTGETWEDHFDQLRQHLPELKERLSPNGPFGIGLRLSAIAAARLKKDDEIKRFREWLDKNDVYLFTINGFPYGSFHGERVKDDVYSPDWTTSERVSYTRDLIDILSELLPEGVDGGISTSPVSYKYWKKALEGYEAIFTTAVVNLSRAAHYLHQVREKTGKEIHLDIEPEPDCILENSHETINFFKNYLIPNGSDFLSSEFGFNAAEAESILKTHIGVCYDTCHFALEYEDAIRAINSFKKEDIRIGKTQVSSALKVNWQSAGIAHSQVLKRLSSFDEPVYLHQVIEKRTDGSMKQYRDLPQAIDEFDSALADEWRVHFHVPLFLDQFGDLTSTRDHFSDALPHLLKETGCRHFEIETYTWEVLPETYKTGLNDSIEREFNWMFEQLDRV